MPTDRDSDSSPTPGTASAAGSPPAPTTRSFPATGRSGGQTQPSPATAEEDPFLARDARLVDAARKILRKDGSFDDGRLPARVAADWLLHLHDAAWPDRGGVALFHGLVDERRFRQLVRAHRRCLTRGGNWYDALTPEEDELYLDLVDGVALPWYADEESSTVVEFERKLGNYSLDGFAVGSFLFFVSRWGDCPDEELEGVYLATDDAECVQAVRRAADRFLAYLGGWALDELDMGDTPEFAGIRSVDDLERAKAEFRSRARQHWGDESEHLIPLWVDLSPDLPDRRRRATTPGGEPLLGDEPAPLQAQVEDAALDLVLATLLARRVRRRGRLDSQLSLTPQEWYESMAELRVAPLPGGGCPIPRLGLNARERFPGLAGFLLGMLANEGLEVTEPTGHDRLALRVLRLLDRSVLSDRGNRENFETTLRAAIEEGWRLAERLDPESADDRPVPAGLDRSRSGGEAAITGGGTAETAAPPVSTTGTSMTSAAATGASMRSATVTGTSTTGTAAAGAAGADTKAAGGKAAGAPVDEVTSLAHYALGWHRNAGVARILAEEARRAAGRRAGSSSSASATGARSLATLRRRAATVSRTSAELAASLTERVDGLLRLHPELFPSRAERLLTDAACLGLLVGFRVAGVDLGAAAREENGDAARSRGARKRAGAARKDDEEDLDDFDEEVDGEDLDDAGPDHDERDHEDDFDDDEETAQ